MRAARAARLFSLTRPIKFLIYGVVVAVPVVDAKTPLYFYLTDSRSPDLEDASDARPDGAKLTYSRDFLLKFQTHPLAMLKPEGLSDTDVIFVQARTPLKSGSQQNRYHSAQQQLAV